MSATTEPADRIATLDIVRGVAVMGILAMNIVAFSMPFQAYLNPNAFGMESAADYWSWVASFIFVDGKMRGLFSFLFGASMLLVIERAQAGGRSAASVHYRRMVWLLLFGLAHFYFIWFGDILAGYAMIGMIAWFFRNLSVRALIGWGIGLLVVQLAVFAAMSAGIAYLAQAAAAPDAPAEVVREWQQLQGKLGIPSDAALAAKLALFHGPYAGLVADRLAGWQEPFTGLLMFGWETLAYFLFGMAALKTGFLKGDWSDARYRRVALIGFGIGIPAYAALAFAITAEGFSIAMVMAVVMAATVPFRPAMILAIAATIILLTRNGGALVDRIAAAGRAAFTNYLGTSIVMTTVFYGYGLGLYGSMSRIELWIPVAAMWVLMLLWSKPWLDRFRYGPFEWLWRSLARWELQPIRRSAPAVAAPAE